ncbi:hypothetical protein KJ780_03135 [Candidatus Micrarchaeota archaeon]|nr:hypothetical protein [Candidatus Micrarchaeota archaeon]
MDLILILFVAVLAGAIVKIVDYLEDDLKSKSNIRFVLSFIYGVLIGCLISFSGFPAIWAGALVAQLLVGKIDKYSHALGYATALIFAAIFGATGLVYVDFIIFLVAASLDEKPLIKNPILDFRPFLKLAALVYLLLGRWDYFIGIIVFDASYIISERLLPKLL